MVTSANASVSGNNRFEEYLPFVIGSFFAR